MAAANTCHREDARRNPETHRDQVARDLVEAEPKMTGDVLEEHCRRFGFANDPGDLGPDMAGVLGTAPAAA